MPKITPRTDTGTITVQTQTKPKEKPGDWWNASTKKEMCDKLLATAEFLKQHNQYRFRQASLYTALYGKLPIGGVIGANIARISTRNALPTDRPTMSIVTSITDTIVSRLTQSNPRPLFLTDNADTKQRKLAKQMNSFIAGEFYQTRAYEHGALVMRDACVFGTGVLKVLETGDQRIGLERRLATQLFVDNNEAFMGQPRQIYEMQLVDREVLAAMFPEYKSMVAKATQAYPDQSGDSERTISDQVIVVEAWRLPSHPKADDGMHVIACSAGIIKEEKWSKGKFPFVMLNYTDPVIGMWGQGVSERQMGNQNAINALLMQIHKSIRLVGVPRVFVEDGSKVVKAQLNNEIGSIVTYRGTKPSYEVAPCLPAEVYNEIQQVINRAYQEEGVSQLASNSMKPAGLNSGEALRQYDDIQSDRFAALQKRYESFFVDLAYQMIDVARDIAKRDGRYDTIYPDKNSAQKIDLPNADMLDNPFIIQCFETSSLPRDPAGRFARIAEWMQAGLYSPEEGRRLLGLPDTEQQDKLLNAAEERILQQLDDIVEDGKYSPPDPFTNRAKAIEIVTQYYNLFTANGISEERAQMLRDYFTQVQALEQQAALAMAPQGMSGVGVPQGMPEPQPVNPMIPNVPGVAGEAPAIPALPGV